MHARRSLIYSLSKVETRWRKRQARSSLHYWTRGSTTTLQSERAFVSSKEVSLCYDTPGNHFWKHRTCTGVYCTPRLLLVAGIVRACDPHMFNVRTKVSRLYELSESCYDISTKTSAKGCRWYESKWQERQTQRSCMCDMHSPAFHATNIKLFI